jgi:hypothetical protein
MAGVMSTALRDIARVAVVSAGLVSAAAAAGPGDSMFSVAGFGTLGAVHSSEHDADFTPSFFKPDGAGYTNDWSMAPDSLAALQATAVFTPRLSAVVQVLAQQNYNDTFWPHVEWADVKYQFTPEFGIRAGRTVVPTFLVSEARNVGYTYQWLRPPVEVYGLDPNTSNDGLDASYRLQTGKVLQTLELVFGSRNQEVAHAGQVKAEHGWIVSDTLEYGALTLHVAFQKTTLAVPYLAGLFDAFRAFGTQGNALADEYDPQRKRATILSLGALYDPGRWFVTAEGGRSNLDSVFGRNSGWFASGGYRFTKFTPYLTYGVASTNGLSDAGLGTAGLPPAVAAEAMALNDTLDTLLSTKRVQNTVSAGIRWDFMKNADFKLQVDHTRIDAGSTGALLNIQPGFTLGARYTLIGAAVDFVF